MSLILLDSGASSGGSGQALAATGSGSAVVTVDLKVAHKLVATSTGVSTVAITKINVVKNLSATIHGVGTVDADLLTVRLVSTPAAGSSSTSSNLTVFHTLRANESGSSVVTATLSVGAFVARIDGSSTVSATKITSHLGLRSTSSDGHNTTTGASSIFHTLAATEHGLGTITSALNVLLKNSANVIIGHSTVSASLGRRIRRSASSNLSVISDYQRIVGILMLVDPSFQIELSTPPTAQTFTFVKKVVKGLSYVDMQASGSVLTCQVKTGDGQAKTGVTDVAIMLAFTGVAIPPAAPIPPTVAVIVGTLKAGAGTNILWVQTTNAGAFSLSLSGVSGGLLVQAVPQQGVAMSAGLTL